MSRLEPVNSAFAQSIWVREPFAQFPALDVTPAPEAVSSDPEKECVKDTSASPFLQTGMVGADPTQQYFECKRGKARAGFGYRQGGQRCSLRATGKYLFLEWQMAIQTIKRPVFTIQQIAKEMVRRANQRKVLFNFPSVSSLNSVDLHQLRRQHRQKATGEQDQQPLSPELQVF